MKEGKLLGCILELRDNCHWVKRHLTQRNQEAMGQFMSRRHGQLHWHSLLSAETLCSLESFCHCTGTGHACQTS